MSKRKNKLHQQPLPMPVQANPPVAVLEPVVEVAVETPVVTTPPVIKPLDQLLKPKDQRYPNNNWDLMETNEVGQNANGGTEMYMRFVYNGGVPRDILEQVQIIPSRLRDLKEDKVRVYFEHNLPGDPESMKLMGSEEMRKKVHKIIFLSQWHENAFSTVLNMPLSTQQAVIEGGFEIDDGPMPVKPDPQEVVNIAYYTTPHRGLELLVPVFKFLADKDKKIHLHVHSSFKMYGWEDQDKQFEPLYEECRNHPQITYHGYTEYYQLRDLIRDKYHIFAYPSIWAETMCRAVLEGMFFGLICVHPNLAALPDTTGCLNPFMYQTTVDKQEHANLFANILHSAINAVRENSDPLNNLRYFNRMYILNRYNTKLVQMKWTNLLRELVMRYPDAESRKFPVEEWTYRA